MSDPAIGRFWQIDPLAEDYVYNGTYNFSENRVIDGVELEGLEYVHYTATDFTGSGQTHNMKSKKATEYSTWVSKGLANIGVNIEPYKVYVLNYKGSGYLFTEEEYEIMLVAQPEDFTKRPTLEGVKSLQLIMSVLAKVATPRIAKPNEVINVVSDGIDKAGEFKNGASSENQDKKQKDCSDCAKERERKRIKDYNSDPARLHDNNFIRPSKTGEYYVDPYKKNN